MKEQKIYRGYSLVERDGGTYGAFPYGTFMGEMDYPNIGMGWWWDRGQEFNLEQVKAHIDELIAWREKRIGWVKEFAQTQKKPEWTERYLLESCDPNNNDGHRSRSNHTEAELYDIWYDGLQYKMRWGIGSVTTSKTKYLYKQFIIERGYILKEGLYETFKQYGTGNINND